MKLRITDGNFDDQSAPDVELYWVGPQGRVLTDAPDGVGRMNIRCGASRDDGEMYLRKLARELSHSSRIVVALLHDDGTAIDRETAWREYLNDDAPPPIRSGREPLPEALPQLHEARSRRADPADLRGERAFPDISTALGEVEAFRDAPANSGIYATWVTDERALSQAGIDGPVPRLMYVGISKSNLWKRLDRHSLGPFQPLGEVLAARGVILPPWGFRAVPPGTVHFSPLLEISARQEFAWRRKHLRWAWHTCDGPMARASELEAIHTRGPLLNIQHSRDPLPPQLRHASRYESARARWLWQMSWAALWVGEMSDAEKDKWRIKRETKRTLRYELAVDDLGYPMPLSADRGQGSLRTLDIPGPDEMWELMRAAAADAPAEVRDAVHDADDNEVDAWFGAHMGSPFLPSPVSIQAALRQSLLCSSESAASRPQRLPSQSRLDELIRLIHRVTRVGH